MLQFKTCIKVLSFTMWQVNNVLISECDNLTVPQFKINTSLIWHIMHFQLWCSIHKIRTFYTLELILSINYKKIICLNLPPCFLSRDEFIHNSFINNLFSNARVLDQLFLCCNTNFMKREQSFQFFKCLEKSYQKQLKCVKNYQNLILSRNDR